MTCDQCRARIAGEWDPGTSVPDDAAAHLEACEACRGWMSAFAEGLAGSGVAVEAEGARLTAEVLARTSGTACDRARLLLASRAESPLDDLDSTLVAGHLAHCAACAELAASLEAVQVAIPSLATLDPGPGFADRILALTSRVPVRPTVTERWRGAWSRLVKRPRFAWEVACAATLCWVVLFGPSVRAFEWTSTVTAVAREQVPSTLDALGQTIGQWTAAVGSELSTAKIAVEERRDSWVDRAAAAFNARLERARQAAAALLATLQSAVDGVAEWFEGLFGGTTPHPAEPAAAPVRSPEQAPTPSRPAGA